jgi:hypothetical protein
MSRVRRSIAGRKAGIIDCRVPVATVIAISGSRRYSVRHLRRASYACFAFDPDEFDRSDAQPLALTLLGSAQMSIPPYGPS